MLNKERLKNVFYDMVKIYSPSKGEGEICAWVMDYLRARGLEPEIDQAGKAYGGNGGNIIVHVPGEKADDPICFMGHLDQIEPCKNVNPIMDGSVIRTDGTTTLGADNKSAAASIFEAFEDLRESGDAHKEFYMLFSVSEEINMQGVKHLDPKRLPCKSFVVPAWHDHHGCAGRQRHEGDDQGTYGSRRHRAREGHQRHRRRFQGDREDAHRPHRL